MGGEGEHTDDAGEEDGAVGEGDDGDCGGLGEECHDC